jgi:hypothetical protein
MPSSLKSFLSVAALSTLASGTAVPSTSYLRKRYTEHTLAGISCGGFSSADTVDTSKNIRNLDTGEEAFVAAHSCIRNGCYNTSGVYLCVNLTGVRVFESQRHLLTILLITSVAMTGMRISLSPRPT